MRNMKRTWLSVLCLLSFVLMSAETEKVRIMTYNIPMGNIPAVGLNTWENRCIGLQNYINTIKPDLLGLQEPVRTELVNLLSGMPDYSMLGLARDDGYESGEYSPIIYNTRRFLVEKSGTYWLSKTPNVVSRNWNSACYRVATWAIFRDKVTQTRFLYTNTHLDHKSDSARENQMKVIKEQMKKIINENGKMPMMLTGDFNVTQSATTYTNATSYLITMRDAWLTAQTKTGSGITFPSSEEVSSSSRRKIDFIMLSTDITALTAHTSESALESGQILSDHNPHWADISWTTTDEENFRALYQQGKEAIDSTYYYTKGSTKLITNATDGDAGCQITSDGMEPTQGDGYKSLIDGNSSTYFLSMWSKKAAPNPHYLQVDLKQEVRALHFTYLRRNDTNGPLDRWVEVMVTASNDKETWDYVTDLYNIGPEDLSTYTSPLINLHKPYRYVRFNVMHTPAMKIRNANPQFSLSEFMVYMGYLNTSKSQYHYNAELKAAVDELVAEEENIEDALRTGTLTAGKRNAYLAALAKMRSLSVEYGMLEKTIEKAQNLYTTYTSGTKYGQVDKIVRANLRSVYSKVNTAISSPITRHEADSLMEVLTEAIETFLASRKTFETNKWYFIQNHHLVSGNTKGEMYGQALYADGNGSSANLANGYYVSSKLTCMQNPYAMWRIIQTDKGYAIQNRATGLYMGGLDKSGSAFKMSAAPVEYDIEMLGVEDFHFSESGKELAYITAMPDMSVKPSTSGFHSEASWLLTDVDDAAQPVLNIPVTNHTIAIMTLPYAYENRNVADNIHTYSIVQALSTSSFALKEKTSFAAGEPFFILTGSIAELDNTCTDKVYIDIAPPVDLVTAAVPSNGLYGLLDDGKMHKTGFILTGNKLKMSSSVLTANTGYIVKGDVQNISDTYDVTLSYANGLVGISPVVAGDSDELVSVYMLDGKCILKNVSKSSARERLPSGVYIIGKQKVMIP